MLLREVAVLLFEVVVLRRQSSAELPRLRADPAGFHRFRANSAGQDSAIIHDQVMYDSGRAACSVGGGGLTYFPSGKRATRQARLAGGVPGIANPYQSSELSFRAHRAA